MRAKLLLIGATCTLMAACSGMSMGGGGATGQAGTAPLGSTAQRDVSGYSGSSTGLGTGTTGAGVSGSSYPASDGITNGWTSFEEGYGVGHGSPAAIANNQMDWRE